MSPKIDDFFNERALLGDAVHGRKIDFCLLYDPETTDSMDIGVKGM